MQKRSFFPGGILSKQSFNLFFQTTESAKCAFAAMSGSGKPAFLHALFLENEKQNSRKNYMVNVFPLNPRSHAKI